MDSQVDPKKCLICHEKPVKYTCPRCSRRTCSLACCLSHKKTWHCNGQREKTAFKSLESMTDLDLLSDYRFLEDVQRQVESSERDHLSNQMKSFNEPTRYQKWIQSRLKALAAIRLLYLPRFATRHQQNQMWFEKKSNEILWHVECRFFASESFEIWSVTRLPTAQTSLSNLLSRSPTPKDPPVSVFTENFAGQRKQNGHYQKCPSFETMLDLFRSRMLIEYPVLFMCSPADETRMLEHLLSH